MNNPGLFTAPPSIATKLNRLCQLLIKEKNLFEQVAGDTTDKQLRYTILSLAQNTNQYITELSSHLQTTGGTDPKGVTAKKEYHITGWQPGTDTAQKENQLLAFCSSNERKMVMAYRQILKLPALYEGLKEMMRYQLSGMVFAYMQLKLLSSVKKITGSRRRRQISLQAW